MIPESANRTANSSGIFINVIDETDETDRESTASIDDTKQNDHREIKNFEEFVAAKQDIETHIQLTTQQSLPTEHN